MEFKHRTACFTGHRIIRHTDCETMLANVVQKLIHQGYCYFLAGGARGFDSLAANTVLTLKETSYPQIHLILVLPFEQQYEHETGWSEEEINFYHHAKCNASNIIQISPVYKRGIYHKRNQYLIEHSSICIAYQYKQTGGTAYTVNYAKQAGIPVIHLIERTQKKELSQNIL